MVVLGETIKANERVQVEQSLKYSQVAASKLWNMAGMTTVDQWALGDEYGESTPISTLHIISLFNPSLSMHNCFFNIHETRPRENRVSPTLMAP